jgi:hypothetical protein
MNRSPILAALLIAAAVVPPAFAQDTPPAAVENKPGSDCPTLPKRSGLTWKKNDGPDFFVCRAMRGDVQVFGMYFGSHPSYQHDDKDIAETSLVAGHEVTWYNVSPDEKHGAYARDALIRLGKDDSDGVIHVWISASDEAEFKAALKALEGVSLTEPVKADAPAADADSAGT